MKAVTNRVVALPFPTTSEDLYARFAKRESDLNDLIQMHFGTFCKDPEVFALLAPIHNDDSVTGKIEYDQFCAAKRIVELSGKDDLDIPQLASLKPVTALRHLKVVLKRAKLMPWQRIEEAHRAADAAADYVAQ